MARTLNNSMRITPDALWGQGYGGFVDTWQLPEVVAHKKKQDAAWSDYMKANAYRSNYLGGRTSGTQEEYAEWKRRAALSDAASSKHRALRDQMNATHDRALGNWASQYGIAYNTNSALGQNPWSWIGGKYPLAMADPLPPPDKDTRQKPNPNQKPSSPYVPGKSPFNTAQTGLTNEGDTWNYLDKTYGHDAGQWFKDNPGKPLDQNPHIPQGSYIPFTDQVQNTGNNDMQIAGIPTALKIGGALAAPYLIKKAGEIMSGGRDPVDILKEEAGKRQGGQLLRLNQNQQSRTGGSQTREQVATTAAGSQGTRDKKRYSNLRIRTGSGNNNTAQLNTGILV